MRPVITVLPVVLSAVLLVGACSGGSSDGGDTRGELTVDAYRAQLTPRCQEVRKQDPPQDAPLDAYYRDLAAVLRSTAEAIRSPAPPAAVRPQVLAQATEADRVAGLMTTLAGRLATQDDGTETRTLLVQAEQAWTAWNGAAAKQLPPSCTAS